MSSISIGSAPNSRPAPVRTAFNWVGAGDRAAADAAVRSAYSAAGFSAPRITWASSPIALARDWKKWRRSAGDSVRFTLFGGSLDRAWAALKDRQGFKAAPEVRCLPDLTVAIAQEAQAARVGPLARVRIMAAFVQALARREVWHSFRAASMSPYDLHWLQIPGLADIAPAQDREVVEAAVTIFGNCGWFVPHDGCCWLSERPVTLGLDDSGRLHAKHGPALRYRDGWTRYAWKGIEVPKAFVEAPERITLNAIDSQTDIFVRRCLIEMLTPKRFIQLGGADLVMRDDTGTLWRRAWPRGDAWAAVEVVNGTPGPDGTLERYVLQVPPELESARAAVAWTYGMTAKQYASLVQRT